MSSVGIGCAVACKKSVNGSTNNGMLLTVFSLLEALYVAEGVIVLIWLGMGAMVVKTLHALVGYFGAVFCCVIVFPGFCCMGAVLIVPV